MHGLEDINWHFGLNRALETGTRGSEKNVYRLERDSIGGESKRVNDFAYWVGVRDEFFVNRVYDGWNRLTSFHTHADGVDSFKARIDNSTVRLL